MAIADTIQSMYDNVGEVYDTITNVDLPTNKNIQNIPSTMRSSYLEIMNNGIDKIWNNWEKVTGEGETLTLNSTEEAPMKINLKGNTSQEGTPTPEAPQDIHVVSGDNSIKVEGKNLLKLDFVTERPTFAGLTFTHTDSTFTLKGTTTGSWTIFNLKEKPLIENGATYTFSANITGTNPSMTISCYFWNKSGQQIDNIRMSKNNNYEITKTINFNGPDDLVYSNATFVIESLTNNSAYDLSAEVQLERNNTKTNFEPYSSNSYNIDLPEGMELCKIGDYQDSIVKDNGKWYLNKQIGKVVLNGSESWIRSGNTSESFFCGALAGVSLPFEPKMGTASDSKTNYFVKGNKSSNAEVFDMYNGTDYYTTFALYLNTSRATDVTTFKNWLGTHNVILYYVLATPTTTEITDTTLQQQLNALEKARSYNSQTNLTQTNDDISFIITATALESITNS